jgi:hypothetical protein
MSKYRETIDPITGGKKRVGIIGTASNGVSGVTLEGARAGSISHIRIYCTQEAYFRLLVIGTDRFTLRARCETVGMINRGVGIYYVSACRITKRQSNEIGVARALDFSAGPYHITPTGEWLKNVKRIFGGND